MPGTLNVRMGHQSIAGQHAHSTYCWTEIYCANNSEQIKLSKAELVSEGYGCVFFSFCINACRPHCRQQSGGHCSPDVLMYEITQVFYGVNAHL